MTVGDLRKALEGIPDDIPVLKPGSDHSYDPVYHASEAVAGALGISPQGTHVSHWSEWHGKKHASEGEQPRRVFVIGG